MQGEQVVAGLLRLAGGRENRLLVGLQHLEPVIEIGGVVVADFGRDAQLRAQEGGAHLGNQFFGGVGFVAETLAELPVEAGLVAESSG